MCVCVRVQSLRRDHVTVVRRTRMVSVDDGEDDYDAPTGSRLLGTRSRSRHRLLLGSDDDDALRMSKSKCGKKKKRVKTDVKIPYVDRCNKISKTSYLAPAYGIRKKK